MGISLLQFFFIFSVAVSLLQFLCLTCCIFLIEVSLMQVSFLQFVRGSFSVAVSLLQVFCIIFSFVPSV